MRSGVLLSLLALGAEVAYGQVAGYDQCKNAAWILGVLSNSYKVVDRAILEPQPVSQDITACTTTLVSLLKLCLIGC